MATIAKKPWKNVPPYIALVPICAGVFIAADDQTVIVTVLPEIMFDLKVQINELGRASWTITGYLLGYVAAMPLIGRMSDVWGHRNLYVASMLLFMVGSVVAALSTDLNALVAARVFQAVGAGALVPISIAMVGDLFPPERRGLPMGIMGASAEAGGVIGPLWGGLIIRYLHWSWVFWINIPLGLMVLVPLLLMVGPSPRYPGRIDYLGGLLIAMALSTLTLGLARFETPDALLGVYAASAIASMALFIWRQMSVDDPLLPLSMFRSRPFNAANMTHLLIGGALIIAMVTVPLMANTVLAQTPLQGGLMLMRMTVAIPVGAVLGGLACQRYDYRYAAVLGLALSAVGFWFMSRWDLEIADPAMGAALAISGLGFGLLIAPIALVAANAVETSLRGAAAALITAMRILGMTLGLAALAAWGTGRFQDLVAGMRLPLPLPGEWVAQSDARLVEFEEDLIQAGLSLFSNFFMIAMAVSLIAILFAAFLVWRPGRAAAVTPRFSD